jgi:hypothetical protein
VSVCAPALSSVGEAQREYVDTYTYVDVYIYMYIFLAHVASPLVCPTHPRYMHTTCPSLLVTSIKLLRLTGAGWGGCAVALVPEVSAPAFLAALETDFFAKRVSGGERWGAVRVCAG